MINNLLSGISRRAFIQISSAAAAIAALNRLPYSQQRLWRTKQASGNLRHAGITVVAAA